MSARFRIRSALFVFVGVAMLLTACQPAASVAEVVPTATTAVQVVATVAPSPTHTRVPDTPTAVPSSTATARPTDTPTVAPTNTPTAAPTDTPTAVPPTATARPTAKPTARPKPTNPPQPTDPPQPTKPPVAASVYSTANGGPQGYTSMLGCTQAAGAPCQPVMPPGDIAFSIVLASADDALLAIFVPFGLSVEKDGANAADMYMTVDAGWLPPGSAARMGTSRKFSQPGHYVIRTNGCLITEASYPACTWWTVNGTIVTFDIQ